MTQAVNEIHWTHPVHGEVVEHVCIGHQREVVGALRVLGIGCSATNSDVLDCFRCKNRGRHFREIVSKVVAS